MTLISNDLIMMKLIFQFRGKKITTKQNNKQDDDDNNKKLV